jgi:hypothetical protein
LAPGASAPHPRFSINTNWNAGVDLVNDGLLLNQWYHLAYTLSEPEKRLDFYIDGVWVAFSSITHVLTEQIVFNDSPLFIGTDGLYYGITGQIRYDLS